MILLISEDTDISTNRVIDWISYMGSEYIRINQSDVNQFNFILLSDKINNECSLKINGSEVLLSNIKAVWFRRGSLIFEKHFCKSTTSQIINDQISLKLVPEIKYTTKGIVKYLLEKKCLGNNNYSSNKMEVLQIAQKVGLLIPETIITNNKATVKSFIIKHKRIISKGIEDGIGGCKLLNTNIICGTEEITYKDLNLFPETFFYSLFQEKINKEFEIRVFFIAGECYAMAIFSQLDKRTKLDFRNYNIEKPNRKVPFILPTEIRLKIRLLMDELKLNTGSIDIIYSIDKKYIFLEVNPVGQYGMVSKPCNYLLDKKIAQFLVSNDY
jgi:ATP-GRASP peptide maturase of grasp-with-spasm system